MPRHKLGSIEDIKYKMRCALVDEQIAAGLTSTGEILAKLKDTEPFQGLNYNTAITFCWRRLFDQGIKMTRNTQFHRSASNSEGEATKTKLASAIQPTGGSPTFEELVERVSLNLPLGAHREVEKLLNVIRPEYQKLLAASNTNETVRMMETKLRQQIIDLEAQVADLRKHKCPDANADLQNENQELRTRIRELEARVEVLSRSTTPRLIARPGFAG